MATTAQMKANRNNAKKSTGPRTEEGKTRASKNSLKHGLLARDTVLPGEDPADFDSQLSALEADIQPANSLEFELVRQIADAQWRMRRLTRLETGYLAASIAEKRRVTDRLYPERLQPGYDGETLLLGSAMIGRTDALVHLARYDGHLSRRFFSAVKQLRDLRRDEREAHEARTSAGSYAPVDPDPYRGRYVPAQAPPPIDPPTPTAARIGFRASRDWEPSNSFVAHTLSVPRRDSSRRLGLFPTETTKRTQFRRTPVKSMSSRDEIRRPTAVEASRTPQGTTGVRSSVPAVERSALATAERGRLNTAQAGLTLAETLQQNLPRYGGRASGRPTQAVICVQLL